ncbi:hypothetical protein K438DRAFT_2013676 [Mycena galopus ATCC 62051]|nr:hypothetical protein K438DRAFT_2013676 [Mycena galopus ATCC 62051]
MKEKLGRFEAEAVELEKGIEDERKGRRLQEVEAAKERRDHEAKTHEKSMEGLKAEFNQAKKAREVAQQMKEKKRAERTLRRAIIAEREFRTKATPALDVGDYIPLVPTILSKPALGVAGAFLDLFGAQKESRDRVGDSDSD